MLTCNYCHPRKKQRPISDEKKRKVKANKKEKGKSACNVYIAQWTKGYHHLELGNPNCG